MESSGELDKKIELHRKWRNAEGGVRLDLSNEILHDVHLSGVNISHADMRYSVLNLCEITDSWCCCVDFRNANLDQSNFTGSRFINTSFAESSLKECDFSGGDLLNANFTSANVRDSDFSGADLTRCRFTGANLKGADMVDTCLRHANLWGADLTSVDLSGADLYGANLINAKLSRTTLPETTILYSIYSVLVHVEVGVEDGDTWMHIGGRSADGTHISYSGTLDQIREEFSTIVSKYGGGEEGDGSVFEERFSRLLNILECVDTNDEIQADEEQLG